MSRRLSDSTISMKNPPSYMKDLTEDLKARRKLMEETPPEEVKYWFEYTGPLQVSFVFFFTPPSFFLNKHRAGGGDDEIT